MESSFVEIMKVVLSMGSCVRWSESDINVGIWYKKHAYQRNTRYYQWSSSMVQVLRIKGLRQENIKIVSQRYLHYSILKRSTTYLKDQYSVYTWKIILSIKAVSFLYIIACLPEVSTYISSLSLLRLSITLCEVCLLRFQLNILNMFC